MQQQLPTPISIKDLAPLSGLRILVAEDNTVNQFMLTRMLREWQVDFEMVGDGQAAVDALQQKHFDLLLLDTHMPVMDGLQVARTIRGQMEEPNRSMPIISLSASSFDSEHQEALDAGMDAIMSKPFKAHELHHNIELLVTKKVVA